MRHLHTISRKPLRAQTETSPLCTDISNDYQARLCFLVELLTGFFLPVFALKNANNTSA